MPKFTIESTYRLPVYRQRTYEVATLEEACALAIEDDDWEGQEEDYETSGATYLTGAWEGEDSAYQGEALTIPADMADDLTAEQRAAPDMLAALQSLVQSISFTDAGHAVVEVRDIKRHHEAALAAIAKAEGR